MAAEKESIKSSGRRRAHDIGVVCWPRRLVVLVVLVVVLGEGGRVEWREDVQSWTPACGPSKFGQEVSAAAGGPGHSLRPGLLRFEASLFTSVICISLTSRLGVARAGFQLSCY